MECEVSVMRGGGGLQKKRHRETELGAEHRVESREKKREKDKDKEQRT